MSTVPTLPKLSLEFDGSPLSSDALFTLQSIRVQQMLSTPTLCELSLVSPRHLESLEGLRVGASMRLVIGQTTTPIFDGDVTAIEYGYEASQGETLRVRAYDKLHRLRKRQQVRMHVQVTPVELAQELTADLGVSVQSEESGPSLRNVMQHEQSDLRLLREVTSRHGLYFFLQDEVLHLMTLAGATSGGDLVLGKSLIEANISVNLDPACRSVTVAAWDAQKVELHEVKVEQSRIGREVDASAVASEAEGPARIMSDESAQDDDQAQSIAQAVLDLRNAREIVLSGVAEGNSSLQPGATVQVSGVARSIAGKYVLTSATHCVDAVRGYCTEISTEPPEAPPSGPAASLGTWGTVTRVDDPENLGRVKLSLPTFNNVETDWLGVVCPGAGSGKGLVALPGPGDQVLVLFLNRNETQAVVLGGLYGAGGPPDSGVENGATRRYSVTTAGGQRMRFDDAGSLLRLENQSGSFVELGPKKTVVHSSTDFEIDVPGNSIVIRGKAIDFVQG
jgi:phage protein D/phage baseplate assembly protein gpV